MERTHKCPTGFPAAEGAGDANQMMPLAANLRSAFLSTFDMFLPIEG